jgi:hypothetical protein
MNRVPVRKVILDPDVHRAVYDGRDRVGHLVQRGQHEIDAFDRLGRKVGTFTDAIEAARAVGGAAAVKGGAP